MNVKFRVSFETPAGSLGLADLDTKISFAPTIGMEFQSLAWKGCKKVLSMSYDIEDDEFYVVLAHEEIQESEAKSYAASYRDRGWNLVGVIADK